MWQYGGSFATEPVNNLATCSDAGRFFNPSTGLGMQLMTCSACDASRSAASCWLTQLIRLGIELLTSGITRSAAGHG